ncbi:MAG: hypothetical protein WB384_09295, partial [Candidatus Sulfotelmatobacter sp.]
MSKEPALLWVKALHTLIWGVFAGSILAIPAVSQFADLRSALWLSVAVWVEIMVLVVNGMRCPLTDLAGRYADEQSDNFDIFLPAWLARHNKLIFGSIFAAAELF